MVVVVVGGCTRGWTRQVAGAVMGGASADPHTVQPTPTRCQAVCGAAGCSDDVVHLGIIQVL